MRLRRYDHPRARATPSGHALGADLSRVQVAEARLLAAAAGVANARFEVVDAQEHTFQAGTRRGAEQLRCYVLRRPGGGVRQPEEGTAARWQAGVPLLAPRDENPFFNIGFAEAAAEVGLCKMLGRMPLSPLPTVAGWARCWRGRFAGIEFEKVDEPMLIGQDIDDVLEYERTSPSASEVLASLSPRQVAELARHVRDRLVEYNSPDGVVMPGAAWLVTAQAVSVGPSR